MHRIGHLASLHHQDFKCLDIITVCMCYLWHLQENEFVIILIIVFLVMVVKWKRNKVWPVWIQHSCDCELQLNVLKSLIIVGLVIKLMWMGVNTFHFALNAFWTSHWSSSRFWKLTNLNCNSTTRSKNEYRQASRSSLWMKVGMGAIQW